MKRLWDISPPLCDSTPVWPGDTAYLQRWVMAIGPGCPVNVSAISLSPHLGAHADAPLHYAPNAAAIGAVDLEPFLGRCRVVHAIDKGPFITRAHLEHAAGDLPARVLVRTRLTAATVWSPAFTAFAPDTIAWLASLGVTLVGLDSPSVDPADSKTLDSHMQLRAHDVRVLENLVLDEVEAGDYELIALPLKLTEACASPVRAVLRSLP
jgi:arylformamidase